MNRLRWSMSGLALGLLVLGLRAAEGPKPPASASPPPLHPGSVPLPSLLNPGMAEELKLTSEQKQAVEKLEKECADKQKEAMTRVRKASEMMRNAMQDIQKEQAEARDKFKELLTEEQKKKYAELTHAQPAAGPPLAYYHPFGVGHRPLMPPPMQERLDLSAEQKKSIDKIRKELEDAQREEAAKVHAAMDKARQARDHEAVGKIGEQFRDLWRNTEKQQAEAESKVEGLLTPEQKKKYEEMKKSFPGMTPPPAPPPLPQAGFRPFPGEIVPRPLQDMLGLTPEQKEEMAKLQKDAEAKVKDILTDAQKKRLDELKKRFQPPMPPPPPERNGK